jgi:aspartokinase
VTRSRKEATAVVVSAGGITDTLIQCGTLATAGDEEFREKLQFLEERHLRNGEITDTRHPAKQYSKFDQTTLQ